MFSVPSLLGRMGGSGFCKDDVNDGGSTLRWASSGGISNGATALCEVALLTGALVEDSVRVTVAAFVIGGAEGVFRGTSFLGISFLAGNLLETAGLIVALEEDVEDSRTDGRSSRKLSGFVLVRPETEDLLRSGL